MTIMENINYSNFEQLHRMPGWVTSDRYEYCDKFYERSTSKEKGMIVKLMAALLSVF